jgi:small subunit ribosomal protein S34
MATSTISQSPRYILPLIKSQLPPALRPKTGNLYQILSRTPTGGVGTEVHQLRWSEKQISDSYWVITRSKFKSGGNHGKAWGQLYWKGLFDLTFWLLIQSHVLYFRCPCESPWGACSRGLKVCLERWSFKGEVETFPETVNVRFYSSCSQIFWHTIKIRKLFKPPDPC